MRFMNVLNGLAILAVFGGGVVSAQVDPVVAVPRLDASLGFEHIDANAPPSGCECFGLNGGYASVRLHLNHWLSVEGQMTGSHANQISALGQNLTLMTYMAGPDLSAHYHRFAPHVNAMLGSAHGSDSYFPMGTTYSTTASSFAYSVGGGVDYDISPRFAIRAIEAQYLHTSLPNGTTNTQNHLMLGAGIVIKLRGRDPNKTTVISEAPNKVTDLACTVSKPEVTAGQVIEVTGKATTAYHKGDVSYSWSSSGGAIQGMGHRITVDTSSIAAGDYVVSGHAVLVGESDGSADCEATFRVNPKTSLPVTAFVAAPPVATPPVENRSAATEKVFHDNVPDALFDYNKWTIRPDTQTAINRAATYLVEHPNLSVVIGGYSDERGTAEYNIALGLKRANATRDALIAAGVPANRMQVISYGKAGQICAAENEACWQQNRRAAFSLHP